jgi:phage terminase Nu1 subunit (DNA packaging protein)
MLLAVQELEQRARGRKARGDREGDGDGQRESELREAREGLRLAQEAHDASRLERMQERERERVSACGMGNNTLRCLHTS